MPRDGVGAPAPRPLSAFILRERRLAILRKKQRHAGKERRRVTALRLAEAEDILKAVIDGGDFLADVLLPHAHDGEAAVALFVTMTVRDFKRLCELGAELEDDEDTGDDEPSIGHCSFGTSCMIDGEEDSQDEPSLGSPDAVMDQRRWSEARYPTDMAEYGYDLEADPSYSEPSLGAPETTVTDHPSQQVPGDQIQWAMGGTRDFEQTYEDEPDADEEHTLVAPTGDEMEADPRGDLEALGRSPKGGAA